MIVQMICKPITIKKTVPDDFTKTPNDISIKQTSKIISQEIREKKCQILLLGHSLGNLIAIEVANYNKHPIDRLILIDVPTKQIGMTLLKSFPKNAGEGFPKGS
ncbi:hypothetical protein [Gudongella sp. DL1XJH-153]|uniref:hypothetical protein n=1 Tax=Gudongella sp. DL1XJH-153 TaxID=3409804 RepID=UPI003BB55535